jgi:hypothetical protein
MENFSESGATHIFTKPLDMQEFILYLKFVTDFSSLSAE